MTRAPARATRAFVSGVIFSLATVAYVALGDAVSNGPARGIDAAARGLAGEAPALAWILTASCLWPVFTAFGLTGCAVAIRVPAWRARIVFSILTTLVAWQTSNALKDYFARPRPDYWIVHQETSYSYSSGHAMFAVVVYWLWAYFVARSGASAAVRVGISATLGAWGGGVIWSRLALGAHYPSDLAGGVLLGISMLALANMGATVLAPRARIL